MLTRRSADAAAARRSEDQQRSPSQAFRCAPDELPPILACERLFAVLFLMARSFKRGSEGGKPARAARSLSPCAWGAARSVACRRDGDAKSDWRANGGRRPAGATRASRPLPPPPSTPTLSRSPPAGARAPPFLPLLHVRIMHAREDAGALHAGSLHKLLPFLSYTD